MSTHHPRMKCAMFGWNCLLRKIFESCQSIFPMLSLSSPKIRRGPWAITKLTWIPCTQECFVPSLVEIGLLVLEKALKGENYTTTTMADTIQFSIRKAHLCLIICELNDVFIYCIIKDLDPRNSDKPYY